MITVNKQHLLERFDYLFEEGAEIECGKGWTPMMAMMLEQLAMLTTTNPDSKVKISCIKEKWGVLQVYYNVESKSKAFKEEVQGFFDEYKAVSNYICEGCGGGEAKKRMYVASGGVKVLCDICSYKMQQAVKEGQKWWEWLGYGV